MQKYSHLLFDHDGVLVNTEHLYYESTRRKLAELDIDLTLPMYMQVMVNGSDVWELARVRGVSEERLLLRKGCNVMRFINSCSAPKIYPLRVLKRF